MRRPLRPVAPSLGDSSGRPRNGPDSNGPELPPSQETGEVRSRAIHFARTGQPSTPAREGAEDKMTTLRRSLILLLFFYVFLPEFALPQNPSDSKPVQGATLHGNVLDPDGRAVANAHVSLFSGLESVEQRSTDSEGRYRFEGLSRGSYTLLANVAGFSGRSAEVDLHNAETQSLDLHLRITAVEEQVVVSASLDEALPSQIGLSVSVISQPEIEARGAESISEVLRGIPGVEVSQTGRRGGGTSIFIRGGNSNYNLVMIDGIQVNQFGGDFDFASLATDGVQRIEVSRGPESALFGSNAVAGVINVVSETGDGPPHFSFLGEGGSYSTRRLVTGGSGLTRGFSWAYSLSRLDSDGVVLNDSYRNQSAYLSLGYSRSPKRQFTLHFFGNTNDAGVPGPYGSDPDHLFTAIDTVSRDKQNLFAYQANYSEQFTPRLKQVFSVSVAPDRFYFIGPFGDSFLKNQRVVASTHGEVAVSGKDLFLYGFEYNHEQVQNTFIADANNTAFVLPRASYAYFAENRWHPVRRWFLTAHRFVLSHPRGAIGRIYRRHAASRQLQHRYPCSQWFRSRLHRQSAAEARRKHQFRRRRRTTPLC